MLSALMATTVSATTVTLGPTVPNPTPAEGFGCLEGFCPSVTLVQRTLPDPAVALVAPASGIVTSWKVDGEGTVKLRVLRTAFGALTGAGTSAPATNLQAAANATNLPILAGDRVGIDLAGSPSSFVRTLTAGQEAAAFSIFRPALPDDESQHTATPFTGNELLFNATITLTPAVAGLTPASGQSAGGETVKIFGSNLDGATGVQFGSKPAIFTVDSASEITATAPAVAGSTVDVTVTGPGGTSAVSAADKYTFTTMPSNPGSGAPGLVSPLTGPKPTLTALSESASRWRRGHQQAKVSRAPVGTTFSFNLSKPATVKLAFTQKAVGRKVRGVCKALNPSNASKHRCTRTIVAGRLSLPGHAGLNKLRFQGLLSNGTSLKIGTYNVSLTARDTAGLQSAPQSLSFTIVG
jgi:hypothetical protein